MNDVLSNMNQSTAFAILAFLLFVAITVGGLSFRQWLAVRKAQIDNADKNAQREADTTKYRIELESATAKYQAELAVTVAKHNAESEQRQYEKEKQQAVLMSQMVVAMDGIVTTQKQTRGAVGKSEETVKQAVTNSEGRVVAAVEASKEDVLAVLRLLGKVNTDVFQPVASEPPDLVAMQSILEDTLQAIETTKKRMATALAASTPPTPPDATVPPEVVVADISPQAVASIMDAVTPKADAGEDLPIASGQ